MSDARTYVRPLLAPATNIVPVGIHSAPDGTLAFDSPDEALLEDLRTMIAAFVGHRSADGDAEAASLLRGAIGDLGAQRDRMTAIVAGLLEQMGSPDGGTPYQASNMLASAFDRFPMFTDFLGLAAGCGDPAVDPLHEDAKLAQETLPDYSRRHGAPA